MRERNSISRRRFAALVGVGAASVIARPRVALPAPRTTSASPVPAAAVRLNSNENPYGPSPKALQAMTDAFGLSWRYPDEHADLLIETIAKINDVARDQIMLGDGSGEILKVCASAFTGSMMGNPRPVELAKPTRGPALQFIPGRGRLVAADPTFEAILNHARVNRAEVVRVPLNKNFGHDLPRMLAA